MAKQEIITGQKSVWQLQQKTGEGDAGEIYQVAQLSGAKTAFLKRPVMSAFRGDIFRQSSQIRNEARIIKALNEAQGFDDRLRVTVPRLLDQSKPGPEYNEGNFIIIEKAEGLNLGLLARVAHKGLSPQEELELAPTPEGRALLLEIARSGRIPETLLADILMRLAHYLDFIHHLQSSENGRLTQGVIWNDVKPDHLFWDPADRRLTVIDWGNARFLESDQTTGNRQLFWMDDFRQFFDEMGKYLSENSTDLIEKLGWSDFAKEKTFPPKLIEEIKTRLSVFFKQVSRAGQEGQAGEAGKTRTIQDFKISPDDVKEIQSQIAEFGGDLKDEDGENGMRYVAGFAEKLIREERLEDLRKLSRWAAGLSNGSVEVWRAVDLLAETAIAAAGRERSVWLDVLRHAVSMEWEDALWKSAGCIVNSGLPPWWPEFTLAVRRLSLEEDQAAIRPLEGVWRIYYTLQSQLLGSRPADQTEEGDTASDYARQIMNMITSEVVPNWTMPDPTPPDSRLDYRPALQVITEALSLLPEKDQGMAAIFTAPAALIDQALGYWERKDFYKAADALRRALLLDPDRLRVLQAEKKIRASDEWLKKVETGPVLNDSFIDWVSEVEFSASELRSQVGPAGWLERILEGCRQLRQGQWPADLVHARPELMAELPWLAAFDRRENGPGREKDAADKSASLRSQGMAESLLGLNEAVALIGPLDVWTPEARGSSARVVAGLLQIGSTAVTAAIKLMRMDQVHYALPLFREEALILSRLADVTGVAKLIECGFIRLKEGSEFPLQPGNGYPQAEGQTLRIGTDAVDEFISRLDEKIQAGWTPYLAVEKQEQDENLLFLCDAGQTRGRYQPTLKLLKMAVQICDILEACHARDIVYRDHKILHYYWKDSHNSLTMIDWNVARLHPDGLRQTDIEMDIVQFGARGLHHILTGRTAPGALPLGPTRPEEIEAAAHTYKTHWTYDDGRLSRELQEILERVLAGGYTSIVDLRDDLKKTITKKAVIDTIPA